MNKVIKILLSMVFCSFVLSFNCVEASGNYFIQTFEENLGQWTDTVGTTDRLIKNNQLSISNTTQGTSVESVTLLKDSPALKDGEVEVNFLYEGQKNFSVIFRGSESETWNWQTVAYNGDGKWTIGQPGGKWLANIDGPTLVSNINYRLLVCYEGESLQVYINNECFYDNESVTYPDNKGTISSDWVGKVGIRLFGNRSTLKINSIKSGEIGSLRLTKMMKEQYSLMRNRWKNNLVGDFESSPELLNDAEIQTYIENLSTEAVELYQSLDKTNNRVRLWPKEEGATNSSDLTKQFKSITVLAKAYGTQGTQIYKDSEVLKEIVSALDFLTQEGRYYGNKYFGNWWDWQIGIPQEFTSILMILYDHLESEKIENYVTKMLTYLPNPHQQLQGQSQDKVVDLKFLANFKNSGANRTDQAISYLGLGMLSEDTDKVYVAVDSIGEIFKLVTENDGFYQDGSFIQHYDIPYTGAYGNSLIKGVADIFSIVDQTQWQIAEDQVDSFVQNVSDAFVPLVINGEMMSFVGGRSVTREPGAKKDGLGSETMYNLLITAEFANESSKLYLQQAAKYWMVQNLSYYYNSTRNFKDLLLTKKVLANTAIDTETKPFLGSYMYGSMDRFVYSDNKINLGISMYSNRISAFEAGNSENKKGWHMSDGMVYLYNNDQQYNGAYWPTVDWYRLPGTTVDTRPLTDELTSFVACRSNEPYVGGATNNEDAAVSMQLNKTGTLNNGQDTGMNLRAKKSWFILDGKMISLGTDIQGTTSNSIETVIENRLLDTDSTYTFTNQDGKELETAKNQQTTAGNWLLLNSSKENQTIGYVMLDNQTITTQKEERSGNYQAINDRFSSDTLYKGVYQKILVEHGKQVTDGTYAYLTYPNATSQQLKTLAQEKTIQVIENSVNVQAVKDSQNNQLGATIWHQNGGTVEGITVNQPATFLYTKKQNEVTLAISNPQQTDAVLSVDVPQNIAKVVQVDEGITVEGNQKILVDTTNSGGKTFRITFTTENTVETTGVKVGKNSLEILKKGRTMELKPTVEPANATDKTINWTVQNEDVAEIKNNQLVAKKQGTTKIVATTSNGKTDSFTLRITS